MGLYFIRRDLIGLRKVGIMSGPAQLAGSDLYMIVIEGGGFKNKRGKKSMKLCKDLVFS